jgi:tumor protein p53-inducible protein 3
VISLLSGGAYSQYATSPKDLVITAPSGFSPQQGAAIPEVWLTAYQLLTFVLQVEEHASKTAIIYAAAAGVGTSLIQLCKMMGIKTIAVASSSAKL